VDRETRAHAWLALNGYIRQLRRDGHVPPAGLVALADGLDPRARESGAQVWRGVRIMVPVRCVSPAGAASGRAAS
jgi:hypothetical protein